MTSRGLFRFSSLCPSIFGFPVPSAEKPSTRKRNGRCPECGARVSAHVEEVRGREERIEKVVAVIGTALVILVLMLAGGVGLLEGILMYGVAGAAMFYLAKKTFKPNREQADKNQD